MTKQQQIQFLSRQKKIGEELMQVAIQNYEAAARSVSEAVSALETLGASIGQPRKGRKELPEEVKLSLRAGLTKAQKK